MQCSSSPPQRPERAPPGQIFKVKTGWTHKKQKGGSGGYICRGGVGGGGGTAAAGTSLDAAVANTCPYWRHVPNKCPPATVKDHTPATNVLSSIHPAVFIHLTASIHPSFIHRQRSVCLSVCLSVALRCKHTPNPGFCRPPRLFLWLTPICCLPRECVSVCWGQGRGPVGVGPRCPLISSCWASHAELDGWEDDSSWLRGEGRTRGHQDGSRSCAEPKGQKPAGPVQAAGSNWAQVAPAKTQVGADSCYRRRPSHICSVVSTEPPLFREEAAKQVKPGGE